jgi:hypothetical protein
MYDAITEFIIRYIGKYIGIPFLLGYLVFLIYFYGGKKWEKFSDFDKTWFSFLIGLIIFCLLIAPLSSYCLFVWNIFSFTNESYIATPPSTQQWTSFFILSLAIIGFIGWLRITNDNKPLSEIKEALELTVKVLFELWSKVIILSLLFFVIALHLADYEICLSHLLKLILPPNLISPFAFIFLFLVLNGKLDEYLEKLSFSHIKHNKKLHWYIIMAVLVIIIVSPVSGLFFFKPTIQDHGETIHSITNDINKSTSKNYATNENETYFIVNESRYQKVSVTVNGFRGIKLIRDVDYDFKIEGRKQGNMTEIDFTIINMMPHTLNLRKINLYTPRSYNLSDWSPKNDGIYDVVDKTPKNKLIFVHLEGNQSSNVTLFLEEIEMNTTANSNNQNNR